MSVYAIKELYDRLGADATWIQVDQCAADECRRMKAALHAVAEKNEPNPARINWKC